MDKQKIGEEMRKAREASGMTQESVAALFGKLSRQSVYNWETGVSFPSREKWPILEGAFDKPAGWLLALQSEGKYAHVTGDGRVEQAQQVSGTAAVGIPEKKRYVPLISFVQAGDWCTAVDNFHPGDADEWIGCSADVGPRAFALEVIGPSMEPEFREGDRIIVDPDKQHESGDFVIAKNGDDEATFKKYVRDGGRHMLVPLNESWGPPIEMTGKQWKIVGRVMEKSKKY